MVFGWLKKRIVKQPQEDLFGFYFHTLTDHDTAQEFLAAYEKMPPMWRDLVVTRWTYNEIANGGLSQFFYNSTGIAGPEAVEGFVAIGMLRAAETLKSAMESFGIPYPRERGARIMMIKAFPETEVIQYSGGSYPSAHVRFAELDEEFWCCMETEAGGFETAAQKYAGLYPLGEV